MWITGTNCEAFKAAGMMHRSAYYTADVFQARCGVNPAQYPQYFKATKTGLVMVLPRFREDYERHVLAHRNNLALLGVGN